MEIYRTNGVTSDQLAEICDGVYETSLANPASPVQSILNWITAGYVDGATLDDASLPTLTMTIHADGNPAQIATVWQNGVAKLAKDLPAVIYASAPSNPVFIYNVPRVIGSYVRSITFTRPNGENTIVEVTSFKVQPM